MSAGMVAFAPSTYWAGATVASVVLLSVTVAEFVPGRSGWTEVQAASTTAAAVKNRILIGITSRWATASGTY